MKFITLKLVLVIFIHARLCAQNNSPLQESRYKPFSILIISPDSCMLDKSLEVYKDTVEMQFSDAYYAELRGLKSKSDHGTDQQKKETAEAIIKINNHALDIYTFKYYQLISIRTFVFLSERFQKYPWEKDQIIDCQLVDKNELYNQDLPHISDFFDVDYIIYFDKIRTTKLTIELSLKMITHLYSRKDATVIWKEEFTSVLDKESCYYRGENNLMCLLNLIAESSADKISRILEVIRKR